VSAYERLPKLIAVARARAEKDGRRRKVTSFPVPKDNGGGWRWFVGPAPGYREGGRWVR